MIDVESFKGEWYVVIDTRYISLKFEDKFGFRLEKYFCVSFSWFLFFGNYLGEFGILENRCSECNFGLFIFSFMIWIKKVSYRKIKLGKLFFISLFIIKKSLIVILLEMIRLIKSCEIICSVVELNINNFIQIYSSFLSNYTNSLWQY